MPFAKLQKQPGTYVLELGCRRAAEIRIGRRLSMRIQSGVYLYVGSALGPGGVRARVTHHARVAAAPRWHIDYLRRHAKLSRIWCAYDLDRHECDWATALQFGGGDIALPHFGASDCRCGGHLLFAPSRAAAERIVRTALQSVQLYEAVL